MTRRLPVLALAIALSCGAMAVRGAAQAQTPRTVYVTVLDRNGVPIDGLSAEDFDVKEGGKTVAVDQATISKEPLQISIIVDDNGTGLFRSPLARFVQRMDGHAAMAISSVTGQTMKIVDYTPNTDALLHAVTTLNARPSTPDGGQLLEGISEAALELRKREARRPVIIALTVGGQEHSTVNSDLVLDQLRKASAVLHVFSVASSSLRATVAATAPRDLLQENMHLNRVLGDGPKQSGGTHQQIVASAGFLQGLQNLANELVSQYRVTYSLAPGTKKSDRLNVSVRRKDAVVRAPSRIPT